MINDLVPRCEDNDLLWNRFNAMPLMKLKGKCDLRSPFYGAVIFPSAISLSFIADQTAQICLFCEGFRSYNEENKPSISGVFASGAEKGTWGNPVGFHMKLRIYLDENLIFSKGSFRGPVDDWQII